MDPEEMGQGEEMSVADAAQDMGGESVPTEGLQQEAGPQEAAAPQEAAPGPGSPISPSMMEAITKGATAMFYTAVQVIADKNGKEHIKEALRAGKVSDAAEFVIDQTMKAHKQQGFPISAPMVISAAFYIVKYLGSLAKGMGARVNEQKTNLAVIETLDWFMGKLDEYAIHDHLQQKGKEMERQQMEAAMQQAQQQGAEQEAPPQDGGMGAPQEQVEQGGMM